MTDQPRYLNLVAAVDTDSTLMGSLRRVRPWKAENGRGFAPCAGDARTLDIDLLLYDDVEMETPELVIPHPRMVERVFVLMPLARD